MKNILMMLMVLGFASCASSPQGEDKRDVASATVQCELVKHKKENWFRVEKDGQAFSKYWYGQGKAQARFKEHFANGHCTQE